MRLKLAAGLLFFYLFPFYCSAQKTKFPDKIKVILLGTFHYGATSDRNSTSFPDLFSQKRQTELNQLVKNLGAVKPAKIFVEASPSYQSKLDSAYNLYQQNLLTDTVFLRNEIEQIGFRLAAFAKLPAPVCVDYKQELPYAEIEKFEKGIGADSTIKYPEFFSIPYPFTDTTRKLSLKKMTLSKYYIALNDEYHRKQYQFDYLHYALGYGYKEDYTGAEFSSSWYNRNMKIFTNILRQLQPADNCIIVLFGASHTNTLRQYFENHPTFEIVELDQILTDK